MILVVLFFILNSSYAADLTAQRCVASVYSSHDKDQTGTRTASGVPLNDSAFTAAHKSFPFGRKVRVTNTSNSQFVIVKITDRGPYVKGRCVDITRAAAKVIGCNGICKVIVEP
jgi:rare lipoprotein A